MAAKLHRQRKQMRLIVAALGLLLLVTVGLIVSRLMHAGRATGPSLAGDAASASPPPTQQPPPAQSAAVQAPPAQAITSERFTSPPQPSPPAGAPDKDNPASPHSAGSIDPKAVQDALAVLAQNGQRREPSSPSQATSSGAATGSDRYPGSQQIEVKDVTLPDIGIPIASQVYTTSDSLSTVLGYYTQRYPDAEVLEVNGQKIVAVNRPGATKVIALGSSGDETRIAILQPAN